MPTIAVLAAQRNGHHPDPGIRAVEEAGGQANVVSPSSGPEGLAGTGGLLVPDANYSGADGNANSLLKAALAMDMPTLLTGRAMYLLNEVFGGQAPSPAVNSRPAVGDSGPRGRDRRRQIYLSPGSKMAAIIGSAGMFRLSSAAWHCPMALREPQRAERLMSIAYQLDDGVIEGLESKEHSWVIAVQFLPELSEEVPASFNNLFLGLVERAEDFATTGR